MNTSFERTKTGKEEWLTPPYIVEALGEFDLDPCAPINRPFETAKNYFTIIDDGLSKEWHGRVWLNPPYGNKTEVWLRRLSRHKNGIALTFARTETKMFFRYIWNLAVAIFFFEGRIKFYHTTGEQGDSSGAPSCLIAYDEFNATKLLEATKIIRGKYIRLK